MTLPVCAFQRLNHKTFRNTAKEEIKTLLISKKIAKILKIFIFEKLRMIMQHYKV